MKKILDEVKCIYCADSLGIFIREYYGHAEIICCKKDSCIKSFKEEFKHNKV